VELLVPLTWPIEKTDLNITVNHHRHIPYLQMAQVHYKQGILDHDTTKILRTVVRIALPSLAEPISERSARDEGIIKLLLYFIRNVAIISPPPNLHYDGNEEEVSRSATIRAFHEQDILHLLLTIGSGIGDEFKTQDVVLLEVLFHLLKGVDTEKLFMNDSELADSRSDELRQLMNKEAGMHRDYLRHAPTRHNRFGTMLWVKRDEERYSTVSGQDALVDGQRTLAKLDDVKKWKRPGKKRAKESDMIMDDFNTPVTLTSAANRQLRHFVEDFLDSAFNPLFNHLRKAMERQADRVMIQNTRQYFYLVSWFLKAHRERSKAKIARAKKQGVGEVENDRFGIIANVLNQETFITLNRFLDSSIDQADWGYVNAGMRCFTQILLTVQDMSESPIDEDQEIADNIMNRIFYEEATHDRVVSIVRTYKNQGFGYLDTCTELAHVHLRTIERYSKENVDLQVRSKRRRRKKKQAEQQQDGVDVDTAQDEENDEADDLAQAHITSSERKFDFHRFCAKFMSQSCVDTFVAFTKFYRELSPEQLKRVHRFFYRAAFKMELGVMLFRVDIIALLVKMVKGPGGLDPAIPAFKEWNELVTQLIKRLTRKIEERPIMVVEMLFSKINSTAFFLEHGYEKQVISTPRAPAELEVKPGMDKAQQIEVIVSILIDQNKSDALGWIYQVLSSASTEREAWEAEAAARKLLQAPESEDRPREEGPEIPTAPSILVRADNPARKVAMFKDNRLRLLMTLVGMQRLGLDDDPDASWIFPSSISSTELKENLDIARKAEFAPPLFDADKTAEHYIRRKIVPKIRAEYDDDDEAGSSENDELLFLAGGPTDRPKSDALAELKSRRQSRGSNANDMTEEEKQQRALEREKATLEKLRKIKSTLMVHDSDDEDDEERDLLFFEQEERRRQRQQRNVLTVSRNGGNKLGKSKSKKDGTKKRKSDALDNGSKKRQKSPVSDISSQDDADDVFLTGSSSVHLPSDPPKDDGNDTETPMSSPQVLSSPLRIQAKENDEDGLSTASEDEDEDDGPRKETDLDDREMGEDLPESADLLLKSQLSRRKRNTMVIDSSDED
jgi:replication fork protection complex subunit Tof1/Swi1